MASNTRAGARRPKPADRHDGPSWSVVFDGYVPALEPARSAQLTLADGRIGTAGATAVALPGSRAEVMAAGVFTGTGATTDVLRAPTWNRLGGVAAADPGLRRTLDLRDGVLAQQITTTAGTVGTTAFSSLARPGVVGLRAVGPGVVVAAEGPLVVPPDVVPSDSGTDGGMTWARVDADRGGATIAARDIESRGADPRQLDRLAVYMTSATRRPSLRTALRRLAEIEGIGFDRLLDEHRAAWSRRWTEADIQIDGDEALQRGVRFSLFHLIGSALDGGETALGARGLTGPGYRGQVFWDADVFVLPFLAATHPAAARSMLEYRVRRLPASMAAAREAGFGGAWFAWQSAHDGRDVTPRWVTGPDGQPVRIWTGDCELHVVADVAWAAHAYVEWTGDRAFAEGPGLRLWIETARFWASRIEVDAAGRGHLRHVVGVDEYHELIDDNAFTNVMARWNLRRAAAEARRLGAADRDEIDRWEALAAGIVDGYDPTTGLYEQHEGFFGLDPVIIRDLLPRPVAADAVLGRERVRQSQIVKQADVLMLHQLIPEEVAPGSLLPNLTCYEPRTAHGSSLSPAIHASLFARAGRFEDALETLRIAAQLDLGDLVSSADGVHVATMGGLWQAMVLGFGGIRPSADHLAIWPRVPPGWAALEIPVRFRRSRVRVRVEGDRLEVRARPSTTIRVGTLPPQQTGPAGHRFVRSGDDWVPAR
ncbi:MAG: glycosyl hydrolase family 65 protein [Candidatus Limnocylindrales bacterium]